MTNKQSFDAVGVGEIIAKVPNGLEVSKRLTEVLYSPEVGYPRVNRFSNVATERISAVELHRRLGHTSPAVAK